MRYKNIMRQRKKSKILKPLWNFGIYNINMVNISRKTYEKFFFSVSVFFTDDSQGSRGGEGNIFYSTLPLLSAHEHWDIYLQLCMWDECHVFLIAPIVFTRQLLDEIYHLIEWPFEWFIDDAMFVCLVDELILGFHYSNLTLKTGGFELPSTITLVFTSKPTNQVC